MSIIVLLGTLLLLSTPGLPLVFSLLAGCLVVMLWFRPGIPLEVIPQLFLSGMDQFPLLAIAFFFLVGELMNAGGITRRILDFANTIVGHIRGGLAQVGILSSMIFAGVSGSAVADAAAVGSVLIPSMRRAGYPAAFSAALVETASVMGPVIPPSIPMIIYAVLAEASVGQMFLAGLLPGILIAALLAVVTYAISRCRGFPREARSSWAARLRSTRDAALALMSPVIIVGGILGGVFTATEAGAIAAAYVWIVGAFVYRELSFDAVAKALVSAAHGTATVLVILGASSIFAWIVADQQIGHKAVTLVTQAGSEPWIVLLAINALLFVVGMFMDPLAALIILVPILLPIALELGIDAIHFGVIVVVNLMIGLCTPPIGYLIYMTASIAGEPPTRVIRESLPFILALIIVLTMVTYWPALTSTIPALFRST